MRRLVPALALLAACGRAPQPSFAPCSILDEACRKNTFLGLEGTRGQLWDPWSQAPPVFTISVEELYHRLQVRRTLSGPAAPPADTTDALHALGLLPTDTGVSAADHGWDATNATAIYWPMARDVTIVDRGKPLDDLEATATLAHEYTHAAQDREFGVSISRGWISTDTEVVWVSLTEGEAEVYEGIARARMGGADPAAIDWNKQFGDRLIDVRGQTLTVASPHTHVRRALPFPVGGLLMADAWRRAGATAMNQIWLQPPASFVEIMLANEGRAPPGPIARTCPLPAVVGDHFVFLASDRLGAALVYAYLARSYGDEAAAWQTALAWRGDQLWSLRDADNKNVTFWRIHVPGVRHTPLGPQLATQTETSRLVGDDLIVTIGLDDAGLQFLWQNTSCGQ